MKPLINYIKNLFGADVRLRKWCIEQAIKAIPDSWGSSYDFLKTASEIEDKIKEMRN